MKIAISLAIWMAMLPGMAAAQTPQFMVMQSPSDWERPACSMPYSGEAGTHSRTIVSGGMERDYLIHIPASYDGSADWPVIFDFHGSGSTPEAQMAVSGLSALADMERFLLVNPRGALLESRGLNTWNIPHDPDGVDDVQFTRDMLAQLSAEFCVNEEAVYATGFSGGARMASELACRASDIIAAVAPVAGLRHPQGAEGDCTEGRPMPILTFHSVDDAVNPYDVAPGGSPPPYWSYGIEEALERWAVKNGCDGTPKVIPSSDGTEFLAYEACADGSALTLVRSQDGGHSWPGSGYDFPASIGTPIPGLDASEMAVTFFKAYRLPDQ